MSAVTRVQRVAAVWPTLHLEDSLPIWDSLVVDGLVHHPRRFDLAALQALGGEERSIPLHCVWGWSRPDATWVGIDLGRVLAIVEPEGGWVTVTSASSVYSACLPVEDAANGLLAWGRDGVALSPEAGAPLRFVPPSTYWAYKGVKWAAGLTVIDDFRPGFWESRVADPIGRIPEEIVRS